MSGAVYSETRLSGSPVILRNDTSYGTGRLEAIVDNLGIGDTSLGNKKEDYDDLLGNIRRLTVAVLDNLEEGSKNGTLDQGQKRLLSSTGTRLLRLWRVVQREAGSQKIAEGPGGSGERQLSEAESFKEETV